MAEISVIVPCYNVEKYINRCVDSIIAQTIGFKNIELILVNDASEDGTLGILEEYESKYPENIIVIDCEENGASGAARNIGIAYSSGRYISYVDADDCIDRNMLHYMYQCAEEYDCDIVDCSFDEFTDMVVQNVEIKAAQLYEIDNEESRKNLLYYIGKREAVWGKLYKRELILDNNISFPEKTLYEDCYFSQLIAMYVRRYCRTETRFYHYFINECGVTFNKNKVEQFIMEAEVQERFLDEIVKRGIVDEAFRPYHSEFELMAINQIFIFPYALCIRSGNKLSDTPIFQLFERLRKLFPDFIHNPYIADSPQLGGELLTALEGLEREKNPHCDCESADNEKYERDKAEYIKQAGDNTQFEYSDADEYRCTSDYREEAGNVDIHYFFQDIYVAGKVMRSGVKHVYDIGSRVEGYISHLLSMGIRVTMIDIRPLAGQIENLDFMQGNATDLGSVASESVPVLSCLHALEHFGLGRYGDEIDYFGWQKALYGYERILKKEGKLYLSVPVGKKDKLMFNAHRIFRPSTIVSAFSQCMILEEFTFFCNGRRSTLDFSRDECRKHVIRSLDDIADNYLGDYDCGIFVFRKV